MSDGERSNQVASIGDNEGKLLKELTASFRDSIARQLSIQPSNSHLDGWLNRLGLDSLMVTTVATAIESEYPLTVPLEAFAERVRIEDLAIRTLSLPKTPQSEPLKIYRETTAVKVEFNVMPSRPVTESLLIKEYRIWNRYIEAQFDREYRSTMLQSPDHLTVLTALTHLQKIAYVYLCHEFGFEYNATATERFKIWPTDVRVSMPQLVTKQKDLVQKCWFTDVVRQGEKRYFVRLRTSYETMVLVAESPVFLI